MSKMMTPAYYSGVFL